MKNRTQQEWPELFKQQATGDLSVAAFCKEHGIGQTYFYKRKSDLSTKNDEQLTIKGNVPFGRRLRYKVEMSKNFRQSKGD